MFESKQSNRLPRLYKVAAVIAKEYSEGLGSIKQLVYAKRDKHPRIQALYALVNTLYQHKEEIECLLKKTQLLNKETRVDPWVIKILITELLYGKKALFGQTRIEQTIKGYEQIFRAHLSDVQVPEVPVKDENVAAKPKYVRVNTLKKTVEEAVDAFRDEEWALIKHPDKNDYNGFIEKVAALKDGEFMVDMHIPSLLIFPPRTHFFNHLAYKNNTVILQDKASCLPVHLLAPPPGSTVLDMCAAPGMKTTQLAAALANQGVVYAVERDSKRTEILKKIVGGSSATCVKVINNDVLQCNKNHFPGVEYILVDPSCSGSGMIERVTAGENKDPARLQKLAGFQIMILRSALTRYPDVKRVVYSTCSLHPEENEEVVRQVLETNYQFKLVDAKKLLTSDWKSLGSSDYGELGEFCLYARPDEDLTNGFFVAVFERLEEGEQNNFFNNKIFNFKKHLHAKDRRKERKLGQEDEKQPEVKKGKKNKRKECVPGNEANNVEEIGNDHIVENEIEKEKSHNKDVEKSGLNDDIGFAETVYEESTKKNKKKKKRVAENDVESQANVNDDSVSGSIFEKINKKKKKDKKKENDISKNDMANDDITIKNKSKKNKHKKCSEISESAEDISKNDVSLETNDNIIEEDEPRKKKRKHCSGGRELIDSKNLETLEISDGIGEQVQLKKKKRKSCSEVSELLEISENPDATKFTPKKKKKSTSQECM